MLFCFVVWDREGNIEILMRVALNFGPDPPAQEKVHVFRTTYVHYLYKLYTFSHLLTNIKVTVVVS